MKSLLRKSALVLVADSNEDNLYLVSLVVQDMGLRVAAVNSGQAAIHACQQCNPSLALLEVRFPDICGREILSAIRQTRSRRLMTAIAVTSAAMPGDRDRCLGMGFDDYIAKPYRIAELEQLICQHIHHDAERLNFLKKLSFH